MPTIPWKSELPVISIKSKFRDIADAVRSSGNSTGPEIYIMRHTLAGTEADFHTFAKALNVAMMKLRTRPPFEEWYDWQLMNFLRDAKITADRQTPVRTPEFSENRMVDVTAYNAETQLLFELKVNK